MLQCSIMPYIITLLTTFLYEYKLCLTTFLLLTSLLLALQFKN